MRSYLQEAAEDYGDSSKVKGFRKNEEYLMHYALLINPEKALAKRFISSSLNDFSLTVRNTKPKHICFNCFSFFERSSSLEGHVKWCHEKSGQIYEVPEEGATVQYDPANKSTLCDYTFFFDFETLQVKQNY